MKIIVKLLLWLGTGFLVSGMNISPAIPQENDLDILCTRFPLNSRCQNYHSPAIKSQVKIYKFDRDTFCQEFSFNSHCQAKPLQIIKFNLDRSGEDDEWIRIEKRGNTIRLVHTTKVRDVIPSEIVNGALSFVPSPILPDLSKYDWQDHRVTRVTFKSDRCHVNSCVATGKKTLNLPKKTNIYQGLFTIEYQEKDLERAISFKIPADLEASTVDTVTIKVPNQEL